MDQVPPWLCITEGYESPTEETVEGIRAVISLKVWKVINSDRALQVLGKNDSKLGLPKVRLIVWPAEDRHTPSQLRSIWKFCYKNCFRLAPYAFNKDRKPYAEFEWVTSPTAFRTSNASSTMPRQLGPTLSHVSIPKTSAVASGSRNPPNGTPSQSAHGSDPRPPAPNGLSQKLGKVPVHSTGAPVHLPSRPRSSSSTSSRATSSTSASVPSSGRAPDMVHPSRKALIDDSGNCGNSDTSTQNEISRARLENALKNCQPVPKSGPSQALKKPHVHPDLRRCSEALSGSGVGQPYSPTPGPSSGIRKPNSGATPSYRDGTKTPGPTQSTNQVASSELGSPSLFSSHKHLPSAPIAQLSRAAGKQPARDVSSSADPTPPSAPLRAEKRACAECKWTHVGTCTPLCGDCDKRHHGKCHFCDACSRRHVGQCHLCEKCKLRHVSECRECADCKIWHFGRCLPVCQICEGRHKHACRYFRAPPAPQLFESKKSDASNVPKVLQKSKKTPPISAADAVRDKTPAATSQSIASTPPPRPIKSEGVGRKRKASDQNVMGELYMTQSEAALELKKRKRKRGIKTEEGLVGSKYNPITLED